MRPAPQRPFTSSTTLQSLLSGALSGFDRGKAAGRLVAVTYGNSTTSVGSYYGYDSLGRVLRRTQQIGSSSKNYAVQATYDLSGAMTGGTYPSTRTTSYNRCVSSATGGVSNSCPTYTSSTNRISGLTYDAAGNITYDAGTGGTMTYDAENRMLTAVNGNHLYRYDADGKRTRRLVQSQPEMWMVYGVGGELVAEYDAGLPGGTLKKEYGYRGGQMLVVYDSTLSGNDQLKWMVTDHLGSTRMLVNRSGDLSGIQRRDYLPFGEELASSIGHRNASGAGYVGGNNPRQKFVGKERDNESGLNYFLARYFSSTQGRFTRVDPYDPITTGQGMAAIDFYLRMER